MKTKILLVILTIGIILPISLAAVSDAAPIFLLIEPASRAGALGSAYVALSDDAFASYWNTGAMAFNRKSQIGLMHTNWLGNVSGIDDIYLEYLSWNQYFQDVGNLGLNLYFDSLGEQEQTNASGDAQGTFSSFEFALGFTYAYQLSQNMGVGTNFKFIYSSLSPKGTGQTETESSGTGMSFAFDFGFKKKNLFVNGLDFGLNIQNIGPNITYINQDQSDPLPLNWRMGFAYHILNSSYNKLTLTTDINKLLANSDFFLARIATAWFDDPYEEELNEIIRNVGVEYDYLDLLALRAGYIYDKAGSIVGPSFGFGVHHTFSKIYRVGIDMAFQQGGELTEYNKTFSLTVDF